MKRPRCRFKVCGRSIPKDRVFCKRHWPLLSPETRQSFENAVTIGATTEVLRTIVSVANAELEVLLGNDPIIPPVGIMQSGAVKGPTVRDMIESLQADLDAERTPTGDTDFDWTEED